MAAVGKLLNRRRAGEEGLAWHASNLVCAGALAMNSPDFSHEEAIPLVHAGRRLGGEELSPGLEWGGVPAGTVQLLLVIEDPDAPTALPYNHGLFLLDPALARLDRGALDGAAPATGVRILCPGSRRGYLGPAPLKGHGPHRYVFQLFALGEPLRMGARVDVPESAEPRAVLAAVGGVLARGRLDGFFERT